MFVFIQVGDLSLSLSRWETARVTWTWPPPGCRPPLHLALPASPQQGIKSKLSISNRMLTIVDRSRTVSKSSASSYLPSSTASPRFSFLQQKIQQHLFFSLTAAPTTTLQAGPVAPSTGPTTRSWTRRGTRWTCQRWWSWRARRWERGSFPWSVLASAHLQPRFADNHKVIS